MKLATLRNGSRDGTLVVVSPDLAHCTDATFLVPTLQAALDQWPRISAHLEALSESLIHGSVPARRFHESETLSPLPRAFERLSVTLGEGGKLESMGDIEGITEVYQAPSASFLAPREPVPAVVGATQARLYAHVAAIVGDVPEGADRETAARAVRLVLLGADIRAGDADAAAVPTRRPLASGFSPVSVTPDELGSSWSDGEFLGSPLVSLNNHVASAPEAVRTDFGALIMAAARRAPLTAGTIVAPAPASHAVIACPLGEGDVARVEMLRGRGRSLFGAIELRLPGPARVH